MFKAGASGHERMTIGGRKAIFEPGTGKFPKVEAVSGQIHVSIKRVGFHASPNGRRIQGWADNVTARAGAGWVPHNVNDATQGNPALTPTDKDWPEAATASSGTTAKRNKRRI